MKYVSCTWTSSAERRQEQAGQAADREQADEAERVEHRRLERDRALVERRRPVEHLDRRGDRDREAEEREHHRRVRRVAGDEHVVAPDEEAEARDGQRSRRRRSCSRRSSCARRSTTSSLMHAHRRQDHDVDGRVRVEPEQVLEQHRVAAERRVEDAEVEQRARRTTSTMRDRDDRRAEHLIRLVA